MKGSARLLKNCSRTTWRMAALVALPFLFSIHVLGQGLRPDSQLRPIVGTIRLVGSNANNAFSSVASSLQ